MNCDEASNTHGRGIQTNFGRKYPKIIPFGRFAHRRQDKKQYAIEKWSRIMWTGLIWHRMFVSDGI